MTHRGISYKEIREKNKDRRPQSQSENKVKKTSQKFTDKNQSSPKQAKLQRPNLQKKHSIARPMKGQNPEPENFTRVTQLHQPLVPPVTTQRQTN